MALQLNVVEDTVRALRWLDGTQKGILFTASEIRRERTGVHATVEIAEDTTLLAYDTFNVARDPERTRLANSAHRGLTSLVRELYYKEYLKHDLDLFCRELWDTFLSALVPEPSLPDTQPQETTFIVRPYVVEGGGTILFAPPGTGKSYTAQLMAVSVHYGAGDIWPVTQTTALMVNLERSRGSLLRRLNGVNLALGLSPDSGMLLLHARGRSLADIRDVIAETIKRHNVGFLVVDSISRAGVGDLTENRPANTTIDLLNGLCPTWLALAHTPRQDSSHIYGGIHFDAGADVLVQLVSERKESTLGVGLQVTKANDIALAPLRVWAYEFDDYGLSSVRNAKRAEFLELEGKKTISLPNEVFELMKIWGHGDASTVAEELGRSRQNVSDILRKDNRYQFLRREGKQTIYAVKQLGRVT